MVNNVMSRHLENPKLKYMKLMGFFQFGFLLQSLAVLCTTPHCDKNKQICFDVKAFLELIKRLASCLGLSLIAWCCVSPWKTMICSKYRFISNFHKRILQMQGGQIFGGRYVIFITDFDQMFRISVVQTSNKYVFINFAKSF